MMQRDDRAHNTDENEHNVGKNFLALYSHPPANVTSKIESSLKT